MWSLVHKVGGLGQEPLFVFVTKRNRVVGNRIGGLKATLSLELNLI